MELQVTSNIVDEEMDPRVPSGVLSDDESQVFAGVVDAERTKPWGPSDVLFNRRWSRRSPTPSIVSSPSLPELPSKPQTRRHDLWRDEE